MLKRILILLILALAQVGCDTQWGEGIYPFEVRNLDEVLSRLEREKRESDKHWQDKIHNVDNELHQRRLEEEKKLLILK